MKFPLFFITGASGVGKTTAARILQRKTQDFMVLDADMVIKEADIYGAIRI